MARIVAVHGIGHQFRGPEVLHQTWGPALRDGVRLSGAQPPEEAELAMAFYGDVFRPAGHKAVGEPPYTAADVQEGFERELLEAWWREAAASDPAVVAPDAQTKVRTPQVVQRALNALSFSRFFAGVTERVLIGMIKQVHLYLTDDRVRQQVQQRVTEVVSEEDTRVLVGHSLGAVVAYEALCAHPQWRVGLVTLGAPLGIRNLVFERLCPAPVGGHGTYPVGALGWTNVADVGDLVALVKRLRPLFGDGVRDVLVDNGSKAHDVSPYLTAVETGQAIAAELGRGGR
jgi:pimeloyl-ACP methyl ester carboxylesterase